MAEHLQIKIGPSVLNADLSSLGEECKNLISEGADYLHLDVMDGHFVPSITFGPTVVKCLKNKVPNTYLDAHMMVEHPLKWVKDMSSAGVHQYTFHIESSDNVECVVQLIKDANMRVGLAIKPQTQVEDLLKYIDKIDVVLIMTVEPGFGGQKFMPDMIPKIKFLRDRFPLLDIEVDGGVGPTTVKDCAQAGANMIVSGTAITSSVNRAAVIKELRENCITSIYSKHL